MPYDWKGPYSRRLHRAASERGRRMANRRWALDRQRRAQLAALTAEQYPNRIVRRIVVIDNERDVREATIWTWDSYREQHRKEQRILRKNTPNE